MRYLSPASSDRSRWVSSAHSTYSAIESHSNPRKSVIRLPAETKNIIPAPAAVTRA